MKRIILVVLVVLLLGISPLTAAQADELSVAAAGNAAFDDAEFNSDFSDDFDAEFGSTEHHNILIQDPFEPVNRGVFWFNDKIYFYALKPVARGYRAVVPRPARVSVRNFFSNLGFPIRGANALLQLKFRDFGTELYRFVINSTFGVAGLFDPADSIAEVKPVYEDFGQTLGTYGAGPGFYLVLPVVGPSSLRDGVGSFVDSYADPLRYSNLSSYERLGVTGYKSVNHLSLDRDTYEGIVQDSLDPYLFVRAAYAQRRKAQIGINTYNINLFHGPLFDSDLLDPLEWFGVYE